MFLPFEDDPEKVAFVGILIGETRNMQRDDSAEPVIVLDENSLFDKNAESSCAGKSVVLIINI